MLLFLKSEQKKDSKEELPSHCFCFSALSIDHQLLLSTDFNAAQTNKTNVNNATSGRNRTPRYVRQDNSPDRCIDTTFYDVCNSSEGPCTLFVDYTNRKCQNIFFFPFDLHFDYDTTKHVLHCFANINLNKYNQGEFRAATDALNQIYSFVATKIEIK